MQDITPDTRRKFREACAEIRHIDETIRNGYERIADCESSSYSIDDNDIVMRETDIQRMMQRRMDLTLKIRKMNHGMAMRRQHIHTL